MPFALLPIESYIRYWYSTFMKNIIKALFIMIVNIEMQQKENSLNRMHFVEID